MPRALTVALFVALMPSLLEAQARPSRIPGMSAERAPNLAGNVAQRSPREVDDSARIQRDAREAQNAFELRRRRLLPVVPAGASGRCDVRLGRFCYWHDDGDAQPPEEPKAIAKEREQLMARLDSLAERSRGDGWIAGQRVRYLVESRQATRAVEAAAACGADTWWCQALEGFALHAAGDRTGADSAFDASLASMPNDLRCRWEDVSAILPDRSAGRYRRLPCAARRALADTLWWLAQPLWSVPGNDRRSEHYARHVMSRLERESRSPYELGWGEDTHELLVRYGWPTAWSRDIGSFYDLTATNVVGYEPHPAFDFIPGDSALSSPLSASPNAWMLRNPDALSRYAPRAARAFVPLDGQLSRFSRGDSMLIVAIADVRGDTVLQGNDARGALAASAGPGTLSLVSSAQIADGRVSARLSVPNASVMASLEVHDTTRREVGRLRKGLSTLTASDDRGTILSDIFFYEDPRPTDASLDDVLGRGVGRAEVARRARIGAFWELTREQPASDSVTLTLTVLPRDGGWLRRLAVRVGIGEAQAPVHMRFVEPIGDSRVTSRALALDFSALPAGRYDVRLRMETARGEHGESTREIRIR